MGKVVFIHPDLGIGGAERAVVDAALALKSRGHQVEFVTSHHDPGHSFQETKDGTLKVTVVGDWLPRQLFGRFFAACAYLRMIYAAVYLVFFSGIRFDVVFCDQISACIPVLKLSPAKVIFYCHFPDMLLTQRRSFWKRVYRAPIDYLEEKTTGMADCILVNSKFTASVFSETFKSLRHVTPEVLYPIPDFSSFDKPTESVTPELLPSQVGTVFLSINRYERKKNIQLAIHALSALLEQKPDADVHLIIAGGYDTRVEENVQYHAELVSLAKQLGLENRVTFLRSLSDEQKRTLLKHSSCLLYTPEREHFGIVPIEAMYMQCPVIAMRSGGPLETVADGSTGFLCNNDPREVAQAMLKFVEDPALGKLFGKAGRSRVKTMFSFITFTDKLDTIVHDLITGG
ncbi:unnamed protein product [Candidula unifasciata]|uniref:Alpha-1,3/1,6-mannosyltransferase ALG2 n=1 Tax=Candidula unifasciata TaxID=100452 RepID=A0A8S3YQP8_9EUPU|nr:unnamed protein product [Candidula unifasciata]